MPHLDKLQLEVLSHGVGLANPEDVSNDVLRRVAQAPQVLQHLVGLVHVAFLAVPQHALHQQWVGLIAHLEHVLTVDVAKSRVGGLKVVEGLQESRNART